MLDDADDAVDAMHAGDANCGDAANLRQLYYTKGKCRRNRGA